MKSLTFSAFFLIATLHKSVLCDNSTQPVKYAPIINLNDGQVRGTVESIETGGNVHFYQGIRYGRALRYEIPKAVEPWSGVYNATTFRDACPHLDVGKPQNHLPFYTESMSEDCLFVNVWTPAEEKSGRDVMVWIYGGGYVSGTIFTLAYDGKYIASQGDVIVVSINYRVGPFGFLYGASDDAPGNVGLHDQILGLQWVQKNIHHFGGDPKKVTLFGQSAGSFAVGTLVLSPLAKGLFRRAIMQSGASTSHYGQVSPNDSLQMTKTHAHNVGCSGEDITNLVTCLRNKTVAQIMAGFEVDIKQDKLMRPIYGDKLLPLAPEQALRDGKFNHDIDLMYGVTSREGSEFAFALVEDIRTGRNVTLQSAETAIRGMVAFLKKPLIEEEIVQFYAAKLRNNPTQDEFKIVLSDVWGDCHMVCPTMYFAEQFARHFPAQHFYSYRLVKPSFTLNCKDWMSVCHGEDVTYLFMIPLIKNDPALMKLSRDMIRSWTNFAKTGRPGKMGQLDWTEAFEKESQTIREAITRYMSLDSADYKMVPHFYREVCNNFWNQKLFHT